MDVKNRLLCWAAEHPGALLLRMLGITLRIRIHGHHIEEPGREPNKPRVHGFWHCHIIPLAIAYRNRGVCVMISEHRDGEIIARVAKRFGFATIRGSTTRGGARALKALVGLKEDPLSPDIAITPDGPRGPARKVQPGAVFVASKTGWPLVPVGVAVGRHWALASWDRFQIPKPFSRCEIVFGKLIEVEESLTHARAEEMSRLFEQRIHEAEGKALAMLRT